MDRVLVATDFSPRSDRALRRASLIAHKTGASLTLVHVVDSDQPDRLIEADRAAASAVLDEIVRTLRAEDRLEADWLVKVDDVHSGILAAGDDISADLITIGSHRSRLRDVFVGTIAERVVRQSTRPLLVAIEIPSAHHRKTLLALDFDDASKSAGRNALAMGIFDHTHVVIMHAFDALGEGMLRRALESSEVIEDYVQMEGDGAADRLRALASELGLPPTSHSVVAVQGTPARTILESAQQAGSDLIVLGTNQRKGFERALVGSVTADVIRDARRDVLIIPVNETD